MVPMWLIMSLVVLAAGLQASPVTPITTGSNVAGMNETELLKYNADQSDLKLPHLTPESFDGQEIIAGGDWLVFFGSQTCPHCQKLTPEFLKYQQETSSEFLPLRFQLAKVSCTKHREICSNLQPKMEFYPNLRIYKDGVFYREYDGDDEIILIDKFVRNFLNERHGKLGEAFNMAKKVSAGAATADPLVTNPQGTSVDLNSKNIEEKLQETSWLVKFYSPFCHHCKAFAPTWVDVATQLRGLVNVGEVDCTKEMAICQKYAIIMYPTVVFINGDDLKVFKGVRTLDSLVTFGSSFSGESFQVVSTSEISTMLSTSSNLTLFYLYDYEQGSKTNLENLGIVAKATRSILKMHVCPDPGAKDLFPSIPKSSKLPLLFIAQGEVDDRDIRIFQASLDLSSENSRTNLKRWITLHSKPILQRFDQQTSKAIMDGKSIVVLGIVNTKLGSDGGIKSKGDALDILRATARMWLHGGDGTLAGDEDVKVQTQEGEDRPPVLFAWIDYNDRSDYLRTIFDIDDTKSQFPRLVLVDTRANLYYDTESKDDTKPLLLKSPTDILSSLEAVFDGTLKGKPAGGKMSSYPGFYNISKPFANFMKSHPIATFFIALIVICMLLQCAFWEPSNYVAVGEKDE